MYNLLTLTDLVMCNPIPILVKYRQKNQSSFLDYQIIYTDRIMTVLLNCVVESLEGI